MIWATVGSRSCFCWLYQASASLTTSTVISAFNSIVRKDFINTLSLFYFPDYMLRVPISFPLALKMRQPWITYQTAGICAYSYKLSQGCCQLVFQAQSHRLKMLILIHDELSNLMPWMLEIKETKVILPWPSLSPFQLSLCFLLRSHALTPLLWCGREVPEGSRGTHRHHSSRAGAPLRPLFLFQRWSGYPIFLMPRWAIMSTITLPWKRYRLSVPLNNVPYHLNFSFYFKVVSKSKAAKTANSHIRNH